MGRVMRASWIAACIGVMLALAACGSVQSTPTETHSSFETLSISYHGAPVASYGTSMVYYPPAKEMILFGGANEYGQGLGDTWVFNRYGWKELHPAASPSARAQYAMAYDPQLGEIVLYGGCTFCGAPGYSPVHDTWAFNGITWHKLESQQLPTYEPNPLLAWDTAAHTLELLAPPPGRGSSPLNGVFTPNDVFGRWVWRTSGWKWDGTTPGPAQFIQASAFVPEPGSTAMLYFTYEPYAGSCPLGERPGNHGCGWDPTGLTYSQTWTWSGSAFSKEHPKRAPLSSQAVTADPRVGRVIAVDGSRVWEWTGATWHAVLSKVPSLSLGDITAAYDPAIGDVIVWGMQTTGQPPRPVTWAWDGQAPIAIPTH